MDKKFFALVLISVMLLAGGCGGGHSSVTSSTNVDAALKGAWTSSNNGTATIADDESDELETFIKAFGDNVPNNVLEEYKNKVQNNKISAPVTSAMAIFDDCDFAGNSGSAKFTAIILVSSDSSFMPIVFNGVTMSTQRNGTNEWTATVPDGTLSIKMTSEENMTLSGQVKYLGYDCEFSTVINKNLSNSIDPSTILNGTWTLDGTQGGGYLASGSQIIAAAAPETASIFFNGTKSVTSFYSLRMRTASTENHDETSMLQSITESRGTLTNICDDVYKFTGTDGSESIIFVENIDEIFVIMLDGQACMFLPLKKVSIDVENALNKTWTASKGMGGGYVSNLKGNSEEIQLLNSLGGFSYSLASGTLKFSDVTMNDDEISATVDINSTFLLSLSNEIIKKLGLSEEDMSVNINETPHVTMTRSGNFLQFTYDGDVYKISFISNTDAFLSVTPDSNSATGEFVLRLSSN